MRCGIGRGRWLREPAQTTPPYLVEQGLPRDVAEVINYVRAMNHGLARLAELPPLVKIAHAQLETIHPFLDGNWRVGRPLITFLLTERGVLHNPVLYLSHYFMRHRQTYYEHLQAVRDRRAWKAWLTFFPRSVIEVAGQAVETARRVQQLREERRAAITARLERAAGTGHKILESLFDRPIAAVGDIQKTIGTTYAAANSLVRLVKLGVLSVMTGYARRRRFRYAPYIALFNEAGPVSGARQRYFSADQKYTPVRHRQGRELIEDSLRALEEEFAARFVRVHRNALVNIESLAAVERDAEGQYHVLLRELDERLTVSRRLAGELRERLLR